MKLRLTQKYYENFTGHMGTIHFQDGLSLHDVLPQDAMRMGAVMLCEWENGDPTNVAEIYDESKDVPAPTPEEARAARPLFESVPSEVPAISYTVEDLEQIASESGISGLREIAEPMGIKGNSIRALIDQIVEKTK